MTLRPRYEYGVPTVAIALAIALTTAMLPLERASAQAPESPIIETIEITGLLRIPESSVRAKLQTRVGSRLDRAVISDDIKRVFRMGTFKNVIAAQKPTDTGVIIRFIVIERPTIGRISFQGNDALDNDELQKVVDARPFQIANEVAIKAIVQKIRDLYVEEGYYLANVGYKLVDRRNNMVDLVFTIDEAQKVQVTSITFLGNTAIDDEELEGIIRTKEAGWFSFLTNSGQFKREALDTDVQMIRAYYLHKGFITIKVGTPVVTLAADKQSIDIMIPIDEGQPYTVRSVDVEGDLLFERDFILAKLELKPGMTFDSLLMQQDTTTIKQLYQDLGYANVTISNASLQDPDELQIDFKYKIQKGSKVHIGRIVFEGNETTRDKVMRRVMSIHEGDLYNATNLNRSRQLIMRLGFFERVDISTDPSPDPELIDLTVRVKERQTGTFQVGAGFSSLENFIATAQISKQNFMGHGQTVSVQATLSSIRSLYTLSFHDPYFLDSNWILNADLFNFQQDFDDFTRGSTGGSLSWGYRFTEDLNMALAYKLENVEISIGGLRGRTAVPIANLLGGGLTSSLRATLSYDTRNDRMFPSGGQFSTASVEWASQYIGSDNEFTRMIARSRWYFNPVWKMVLKLNATIGYVISGTDAEVPIFERFFVGGIFDVRGFQRNSLGPRIKVAGLREPGTSLNDFTVGGNKELIFNVELEIPILAEVGIRGVLFFDAGNAYDDDENIDVTQLRTAVGFGIRWWSPVGPLRFEWGIPLDPRPGEEPIVFEFTIGNSF